MLHLNENDVDKAVLTSEGKEIGKLSRFEDGTAYVEPTAPIPSTTKRKLHWESTSERQYVLKNAMVHSITDEEIRIRR